MRGPWQFVAGQLLAPLSPRDVWFLVRTSLLMTHLDPVETDCADPTDERYHRHILDWLREPTDEGYLHTYHTSRANDAAYRAECGSDGTYTSDEDECGSLTSDEDD
jgi:hypothetical protein